VSPREAGSTDPPLPIEALERIAYLLEREREPTYRVKAFRAAAATLRGLGARELRQRATGGTLRQLPGIGATTAQVIEESLAGRVPGYLARLESLEASPLSPRAREIRAGLKGDCHTHSDWSDGGSSIEEMAQAARDLGYEYIVLTDHSPRLRVANGLSEERLRQQLAVVTKLNNEMAPFRILTGIEVDILDDGSLDQSEELLGQLDIVVASVHSKLRMPKEAMTRRMVQAVANPHVDVLGHCTGRMVSGPGRAESELDAEIVFAACQRFATAVEINSRPERLDPPRRLLRLALETGCEVTIDTDAHAPGQLEWITYGCERAADCDAPLASIVNALSASELLEWAGCHHQ
jgi:putative hydrolase